MEKKKKSKRKTKHRRGPQARLSWPVHRKDGKLRRSVWIVVTGWSFETFAQPSKAKARWRKLNANAWTVKSK